MRVYNIRKNFFGNLSINLIFILLNVLFYLILLALGFFSNSNCDLTICRYIALKPISILNGQYLWTFLTSMFMHAGFFHLFANMLSLLFIGSLVEKIIGRKRYFWFYITAGLFAGLFFVLASFIFPVDLNTFAVGASGAIFGLVGLLMFLTPNLPVYIMFIPIPIKMKYAAPGILILLWFISITGGIPVGNTAHLGGLMAGLIYGFYLMHKFPNKTRMLRRHFS